MTIDYNTKNIRELLIKGFNAAELRIFCFDQPDFKPVYEQLAEGSGKDQIVHKLIEYAEQKELFDPLLAWTKEQNPARYKKHYPYHFTSNIAGSNQEQSEITKIDALLLRECTVRLQITAHARTGSGFFVAPGLILTCAHVVEPSWNNKELAIKAYGNGKLYLAQILEFTPTDYPDLALLSINQGNHPYIYFDDQITPGDKLYTYGYTDNYPEGDSSLATYEGPSEDKQTLHKFKGTQIRPGMSGSPLLNLSTGAVCGIVNKTRDRSSDLGGRAVPAATILEQFPNLIKKQSQFHQYQPPQSDQLKPVITIAPTYKHPVHILVSNMSDDLRQERKDIIARLRNMHSPDFQLEISLSQAASAQEARCTIEDCDIYVGLLTGQYGPKITDNISTTELEIFLARNRDKPTLLYRQSGGKVDLAQQALLDQLESLGSGCKVRKMSAFDQPKDWADLIEEDVMTALNKIESQPENKRRAYFNSNRRGLIASVGRSPGAVTGLYYALGGEKQIDYVWTISTADLEVQRAVQTIRETLNLDNRYEDFPIKAEAFTNERDVIEFKRAFVERLVRARLSGDTLAIGVAGGRTVMGALLTQVAQMEAPAGSAFYQLSVPDQVEEDGRYPRFGNQPEEYRKELLNPKASFTDCHLVEITFNHFFDDSYEGI